MTPEKAFWAFFTFVLLVFLMGGGSRYDIDSVGPLRALAALFLAIGIYYQSGQSFRQVAAPVVLLVALGLWMVVQLIPLPPSWWTSLHGRESIARAGELIGLQDVWRPITFSPLRTFNSLASLVVPLAALVWLALLDEQGWRRVQSTIIAFGVLSALLGIAQISLNGAPGLYLYEVTNSGSAVGLFSNRNHNALFLNIALLFCIFRKREGKAKWKSEDLFILAGQIALLGAILINGSRFGIALLGIVAIIFAVRVIWVDRAGTAASGSNRRWRQTLVGILAGVAAIILIGFFAALDQIPAVSRLFDQGVAQDLRVRSFPDVLHMAIGHFPFGVGFGAFEQAYRTIESEDLLSPAYFNQAHNDWLQVVVEGGLPGVLLLFVGLLLTIRRVWSAWKSRHESATNFQLVMLGLLTLLLIGMHSIVDYPLRVPAMMCVATVALGMVFASRNTVAQV